MRKFNTRAVIVLAIISTLATTSAYQILPIYRVILGPGDNAYVHDFWDAEQDPSGIPFRWSKAESQLIFHNAGQILPTGRHIWLELRMASARPPGTDPPVVRLSLSGRADQVLGEITVPSQFTTRKFAINSALAGAGDWTLTLDSETFQPENDGRALGVVLRRATLFADDPTPPLSPDFPSALYAILAPVLVFLSVLAVTARTRLNRLAPALAFSFGLVLTLVFSFGIAFAREVTVLLLPFVCAALLLALAVHWARVRQLVPRFEHALRRRQLARLTIFGGLALAALGEILLTLQSQIPLGVALLLIGVGLFFLGGQSGEQSGVDGAGRNGLFSWLPAAVNSRVTLAEFGIIALVTALAFFFRLYHLDQVPFAIFRDDARHGLTALLILHDPTFRPLFLGPPINQPIPYFFGIAAAFQILGVNLFALRLVSAIAGALVVPLLWWFTRRFFSPRIALIAAFGLAISTWHVALSRFVVNYVEPTLFALPAYYFLWNGFRRGRLRDFALAGLCIALGQYSAQTARGLFLVAGALALDFGWSSLRARWNLRRTSESGSQINHSQNAVSLRRTVTGIAMASVVGLIALAPLLDFALEQPQAFFARAEQVSIWDPQNSEGDYLSVALANNVGDYAGAFNAVGDPSGWWQVPGKPFLDPIFGLGFAIGVVSALSHWRRREYRFVLIWLLLGLIAGILTNDAPTESRVIEAAAPAYVLAGLGLCLAWEKISALQPRASRQALSVLVAALLVGAMAYNYMDYFVVMYYSPQVWHKYAPIATQLGETLNELAADGRPTVYVPRAFLDDDDDRYVTQFFARDRFTVRAYSENNAPTLSSSGTTLVVIPNYHDFYRLVAGGRTTPAVEQAAADEEHWRAQVAPVVANAQAITGASFPGSDAPTFWLYIVHR